MASSTKMQYVHLGKSGLKVSRIILGCMSYGDPGWQGWVLPEAEGIAHIKAAYDAGIQTFDTADMYSNGLSEIILGKALKHHSIPRESVVIMTKICIPLGENFGDNPLARGLKPGERINQQGLSRKYIFAGVKASLERLQLDYIDVLQCHRFDPETPIEETMQALHDVVQAGYVRYIGMSSCYAWQFHVMQNYAINHKLTPFIVMQNQYSLIYREEEREMFPTLKHFGVGAIPWSPLAGGAVARPISQQTNRTEKDHFNFNKLYTGLAASPEIIKRVEEVSKKKEVSMAQIGIAWLLAKDGVSAPIVGTTNLKNLYDIIGALDVKLTEEEVKYLEEPYKPQAIIGHH